MLFRNALTFLLSTLVLPAVSERRVRQCIPFGHYKPKWMRLLAVAVAMACAAGGAVNYTKAGQLFQVQLGYFATQFPDQPATLSEPASAFVRRWYEGFQKKGSVDDDPKPGRPPKIPDAAAREAAEIVVRGYTVQHSTRQGVTSELKYFSTLPEAIAHNETLRNTLHEYHATPEQLLNAMHRVAPDMVRRKVTFRHKLSQEEIAKRQKVAGDLLGWLQTDPTLLTRMVFIDETTIQTHSLKHEHLEVWVNSSDTRFHDFHGVPGKAWDPVKAHVIAAVTAHPFYDRLGGLVYVEFTTGTTDIKRRVNKRLDGSTRTPTFKYLVSVLLLLNGDHTSWAGRQGQPVLRPCEGLSVQHLLALAWHPLASIARAEHNSHKTLSSSQGGTHHINTPQVGLMDPDQGGPLVKGPPCLLKISSQHLLTTAAVHVCPVVCAIHLDIVAMHVVVEVDAVRPKLRVTGHHLEHEHLIHPLLPQHMNEHALCGCRQLLHILVLRLACPHHAQPALQGPFLAEGFGVALR